MEKLIPWFWENSPLIFGALLCVGALVLILAADDKPRWPR